MQQNQRKIYKALRRKYDTYTIGYVTFNVCYMLKFCRFMPIYMIVKVYFVSEGISVATLKDIENMLKDLTKTELKKLLKRVDKELSGHPSDLKALLTAKRYANNHCHCTLCGSLNVKKDGHRKDKYNTQKYFCNDCKHYFTITTNSIVSGTRKDLTTWQKYINCMMNGFTVRQSADECGIHKNTAFRWRHKILDALTNMMNEVELDGIVEADETYFKQSFKGNHKKSKTFVMPRKRHSRGGKSKKRGLSKDKVCVPCAVNKDGLSVGKPATLGKPMVSTMHKVFDGRITSSAILCTDGEKAYQKFSKDNKIELVQIAGGKGKKGNYHIQHINNYHSRLKDFIKKFNGVSTKYLGNYIVWHNFVNFAHDSRENKEEIMLNYAIKYPMTETNAMIPNRPATP